MCASVLSHVRLCNLVDCNPPGSSGSLSMGFPRKEYWSGLPFPSLRALPDPETELMSPVSPVTRLVQGLEEERALEMGISAGLGEASWGFEVCLQRKDKTGSGDL